MDAVVGVGVGGEAVDGRVDPGEAGVVYVESVAHGEVCVASGQRGGLDIALGVGEEALQLAAGSGVAGEQAEQDLFEVRERTLV